jgi:hypothetical protein
VEIIRKKFVNFPVSGFVCRSCGGYFHWSAPKKALLAKRRHFRNVPCSKIPEMMQLLKPPLYCRECRKKLGMR